MLLDECLYFNDPEPRMRPYRWMRLIPLVAKSKGIFHYRLGKQELCLTRVIAIDLAPKVL